MRLDPILPGPFGPVQGGIGVPDEVIRSIAIGLKLGHPQAHGYPDRHSRRVQTDIFDGSPKLLGGSDRAFEPGLRQDQHKLLSPIPGHDI